ncbi:SDR family NAD(P)-dependent oxidoreductase [Ramlibacter alkalitolerans]|uniref:SDR family NAD(P)-dependent oxidoreductase n=1 Tax=Ramlibacter alkalitolerans TaxID=2039631 RepID=A0ABS1JGV7_9BURK|nr:SDR family NAD(P)-dependent oxidoreductase [Ramlibacter alkalitolerans]MBL0423484.1 SDR family NAD(P)-dependent oxidoreductase [Ramlibacter alkalitolerans]
MSSILVTGAAGFIGMHVCRALLARGDEVLGVDNLNDYYDPALKQARLAQLHGQPGFSFEKLDIADTAAVEALFARRSFDRVVHLAAQAGVRHSLTHPHAYVQANLVGFVNVLEGCRAQRTAHLVYASSSSVYGGNTKLPFSEDDRVDSPVSLYAATKKANELMAHSYAHLYGMPCTGLRFFTVYGPWGRPDMACWKFARAMLAGEPVPVFNHGDLLRDFTYIDDIVAGVLAVLDEAPAGPVPQRVLNIGGGQPVQLLEFIRLLEAALGVPAQLQMLPMQPGDVPATFADASRVKALPAAPREFTPVAVGLRHFADWYRTYHDIPAPAAPTPGSEKEAAHDA